MGISELMSLKSEYERELIMAQAKVVVINDILARCAPTVSVCDDTESVADECGENDVDAVEPLNLTDNTYC